MTWPSYLALAESGELQQRASEAVAALASCRLCPRHCKVDRLHDKTATCHTGRYARVASFGPHHGEEDCLRGWRGSGTIFFAGCNLRCVFCQNWGISQAPPCFTSTRHVYCVSDVQAPGRLAEMMLGLHAAGCHNINWVTPEHVVPQCLEALALAATDGLRLPVVYNTGAYDSMESLRLLDGVVDIYMPDFKFWDSATAFRLVKARDYPEVARCAIREMHRQVGVLTFDADGLARRGVLVRHLVLPGNLASTAQVTHWLAAELSSDTYVNVMGQYHPAGNAGRYAEIARPITANEFRQAMSDARAAGLHRFDSR